MGEILALTHIPSESDSNRTVLGYNGADLMDEVVKYTSGTPATQSAMTWDADEERLRLSSGGSNWDFLYDPEAGVPAVVVNVGPSVTTYYLREPGGELLGSFEASGSDVRWYHFDALGSTVLVTDSGGSAAAAYAYGAWGNVLNSPAMSQPYQYVGQLGYYTHTTTQGSELAGWLQLGVRFYDAATGRFERRDPLDKGVNHYCYVDASPTSQVDPSGLLGEVVSGPIAIYPYVVDHFAARCGEQMRCMRRWYDLWLRNNPWNKEHFPVYGEKAQDKIGHCFVTCKAIKDCGFSPRAALMIGGAKEFADYFGKTGRDADDQKANEIGADIARRSGSNCLPDCVRKVGNIHGPVAPGPYYPGPW